MNKQRRKRLADVREKAYGLHAALDALAEQARLICDEENDALDALPDAFREGARGSKMEEGAALLEEVVERVTISFQSKAVEIGELPRSRVLTLKCDLDAFARRDGFDDWRAFADFFARAHRGAVVFTGDLIRWRDFEVAR